ncbi:unnamed protein product [Tuber aestivum]|uniref:Cell wall proline rich protein n=1 Tax=Tuber aestivum TaxID=59557 RepID=A0A292PV40_9PEZI|nr:unnamed protein product [Tuber aestivum]
MATIVRPSQTREPSITRLECDVNLNFTFPAIPHARSQSLLPGAPPSFPAFPPRRGSVPLNDVAGLASATLATARPKSSSSNSLLSNGSKSAGAISFEAGGLPSPISPGQADVGNVEGSLAPHYAGGIRPGARILGVGVTPTIVNASLSTKVGPVPEGKGHHRGLSDLLGGPITLEPKKEDIAPAIAEKVAPKRAPPPPGATRRGHAHRRSGAISSGDVWSLLSQSAPNLALACTGESGGHGTTSGNAEASSPKPIASAGNSPLLSWSAPVSPGFNGPSSLPSPTSPLMDYESAADKKSRVHFIDHVEIIPRPMSAGTETSSLATVRGHAGTDSINSIASVLPLPAPSPTIEAAPPRRHGRTRSNSQTMTQPTSALRAASGRPSTAGAILLTPPNIVIDSKESEVPVPSLERPATASPSLCSVPGSNNHSPTELSPSKKTHKKALSDYSPLGGAGSFSDNRDIPSTSSASDEVPTTSEEPSKLACKGKGKKKKKGKKQIKNWAGTILGRGRGLRHSKRQLRALPRRSPTPPLPRSEHQLGDNEWISAAWNESYVLMPVDDSLGANSSSENIAMDTGIESPTIDLDAALGPFKTPTGPSAGFAAARRRRMHSAVGLKGTGYFHRRSESMPEMQLFSLSEHEGDGHMADVFEEDEEEDSEESEESEEEEEEEGKMNGGEGLGIGIKVVDGDGANWQEDVVMEWGSDDLGRPTSRRGSGGDRGLGWQGESSLPLADTSLDPKDSATSINSINCPPDVEAEPSSPLPFSGRKGAPADIITPKSSSSTVILPAHFPPPTYPQPLDSPSTFVTAASNPNTPLQLDFPGNEYADSASSFDPCSNFFGEPGPEMRMSVDDIPSLTSSSSTMTIGGLYANMPSTPMNELREKELSPKKEKSKRWSKVWTFWRLK